MSKLFIEDSTLSAIGDAIRSKAGTTDLIAPGDMPSTILNLPSGGGELVISNYNYNSDTAPKYIELPEDKSKFGMALCYINCAYYNTSGTLYTSTNWVIIDVENDTYVCKSLFTSTYLPGTYGVHTPEDYGTTCHKLESIATNRYIVNQNYGVSGAYTGYPSLADAKARFKLLSAYRVEVE